MAKRNFYTPNEVSVHNAADDCWVSFLGKVYNLTPLLEKNRGELARPIIEMAGKDISHWFDPETGDVKTWIDPRTNLRAAYTPQGRFIGVPPDDPVTTFRFSVESPWWKTDEYCIGRLSKRTRFIRIVNTLTHDEHTLEVCAEETLNEIRTRYLEYNAHAASYTWKRLGQPLAMDRTLAENGIADESDEFDALRIPGDFYYPALMLYFDDDLTVA